MYICMTWQKFILKKKTRKFMHIHIFDISPLDYFWTDCLIRVFFCSQCVPKRVFLLLPANSREPGERCWSHKRGTQCRRLVKSLSTLPRRWGATTTLRKRPYVHFEKKTARVCYSTCWRLIQTSHQKLRFTFKNWIFVKRSDALVWSEAQLKRFRESIYG